MARCVSPCVTCACISDAVCVFLSGLLGPCVPWCPWGLSDSLVLCPSGSRSQLPRVSQSRVPCSTQSWVPRSLLSCANEPLSPGSLGLFILGSLVFLSFESHESQDWSWSALLILMECQDTAGSQGRNALPRTRHLTPLNAAVRAT